MGLGVLGGDEELGELGDVGEGEVLDGFDPFHGWSGNGEGVIMEWICCCCLRGICICIFLYGLCLFDIFCGFP